MQIAEYRAISRNCGWRPLENSESRISIQAMSRTSPGSVDLNGRLLMGIDADHLRGEVQIEEPIVSAGRGVKLIDDVSGLMDRRRVERNARGDESGADFRDAGGIEVARSPLVHDGREGGIVFVEVGRSGDKDRTAIRANGHSELRRIERRAPAAGDDHVSAAAADERSRPASADEDVITPAAAKLVDARPGIKEGGKL